MKEITLEELLEAGCHFGHQVTRQNPKARDFVYEARDNIHIIDLAKTKEELEIAGAYVKDLAAKGGTMLILGTKRQAKGIIEEGIKKTGESGGNLYSVTSRWIGGTFTNFSEVAKNFKKLQDLKQRLQDEEEKAKFTKREIGLWEKERQKLELFYGGIVSMQKLPDAIFIIDSHLEDLAVLESRRMGVTTVAIVDTNSDPTIIDYPIPANDDAVGSIKLIFDYILEAWIEGISLAKNAKAENLTKDTKSETRETHEKEVKTQKASSDTKTDKKSPRKTRKKAKSENEQNSL